MGTPVVFIVDDDPSSRRGLVRLVTAMGFRNEAYASARDFLAAGRFAEPGCVVLDVRMPGMTGLELQEALGTVEHHVPIIFISAFGDVPSTAKAMKLGAVDFLTKPVDAEQLCRAIDESIRADKEARAAKLEQRDILGRLSTLTPREHEVMIYVISGRMNKEIAYDLGISEVTVKIHRGRVMRKVGVDSLAELVRICERVGVEGFPGAP